MISSGINLVMTVIGFTVSTMFIVFVCTRLICARIQLNAARLSFSRASNSHLSVLERGLHGIEPVVVANFPTIKYRDICLASKEIAQCSICLSDYNEEDTLLFLPLCRHSFHESCIDMWLKQRSTCPVCRVSLRELTERKWFMQPMFSSAIRSQYSMHAHCCHCILSNNQSNRPTDRPIPNDDDNDEESTNTKVENPSSR